VEKKSSNFPYPKWEQELNYYVSMGLGIDVGRLKRYNWKLEEYYDKDLTPLDVYNIVNNHMRLDD